MKIQYLVTALLLAGLSNAWKPPKEGDPCYSTDPCGEKKLVKTEHNKPCTDCEGPNICMTVKTYRNQYYYGYLMRECPIIIRRKVCKLKCQQDTNICDYFKNTAETKYYCCKGFTVHLHHGSIKHHWTKKNVNSLITFGCPVAIQNSIYDCLNNLRLTKFANLFSDSLKAQVKNDSAKYTIFAPLDDPEDQLSELSRSELDVKIKSHIIRGRHIPYGSLDNGMKIKSMAKGRYIHVNPQTQIKCYGQVEYRKILYINGQKLIAPDACLAKNGIVHVIQGVICSSNNTIADIINSRSEYSILASLFKKANLFSVLNNTDTKCSLMTLFAPTNEAFKRSSIDVLKFTTKQLVQFLKYHYTCGSAVCSSVLASKTYLLTEADYSNWTKKLRQIGYPYETCNKLLINYDEEGIIVGATGSRIITGNIPASNGVIHRVSSPLLYPCLMITELCSGPPMITPNSY